MLKYYGPGEHKGGFVGYRVAVMVDGKHKQKYLKCSGLDNEEAMAIHAQAEELHKHWMNEQALARKEVGIPAKIQKASAFSTPVRGIALRAVESEFRFYVQGSTKGRRFRKAFSVAELGFMGAWYSACKYYAEQKNGSVVYKDIAAMKPKVDQCLIVYKAELLRGRKIHPKAFPPAIKRSRVIKFLMELIESSKKARRKQSFLEFLYEQYLLFSQYHRGRNSGLI